jgi:hypothetical protein
MRHEREAARQATQRRAEDLSIAVDILLRSVPAINDLIAALDGAGGSVRLVGALRAELARRRGGGRR